MNKINILGSALTSLAAIAFTPGCSSDASPDAQAPEVTLDDVTAQDMGTQYNGWSHAGALYIDDTGEGVMYHTLFRSSGDTARGGGGCMVKYLGNSCSSDSACQSPAEAEFGGDAWGYCAWGVCFARPGTQQDYCAVSPYREDKDKVVQVANLTAEEGWWVLGCMSKAAGPSTACGTGGSSEYMRFLWEAEVTY